MFDFEDEKPLSKDYETGQTILRIVELLDGLEKRITRLEQTGGKIIK